MIGKRIGERYELLRVIGEGGMSRVYLAKDMILDREVAIKILHYDFANEEDLKKRFQREALSATSLSHPNIVDIYDVGEDGELHYLVMEYVRGETLKTYIQQRGYVSAYEAVPIMKQLVSAISHAHHNGIIHRDIKPQNILMDEEGNVKITDFGIAMALNATAYTKTNSIIGTVHYLSPEQARGGIATKRSDIYSLGIVFYELLTGQLPFAAETAVAIALKHLQEHMPFVRDLHPEVPQSVENVILKATTKSADDRYASADDMYDDLETVLEETRLNEPRFIIPYDDDATKVMPAIKDIPPVVDQRTVVPPSTSLPATEEATPSPPSKKKRKKKWWFIGGLLIVLLGMTLPFLLGDKRGTIPDVVGQEEKAAIEQIESSGFVVDETIEEPSEEVPEGIVTRTIPTAGMKREKGSTVTIYRSSGKEKVAFTSYVGHHIDDVKRMIEDFNFKSVNVKEQFSDAPVGEVIQQNIRAGEEVVPNETEVEFTVSKGVEKKKVEKLIGLTDTELTEYAKSSGFDIRIAREEYSATVEKGRVISQQPSAGSTLEVGGQVNVVVSKGPPAKPMKLIVQTVHIPYEVIDDEEEREPQQIRIYVQDRNHSMTDPVEQFDITEDVKKRITIELEEGQRGGYRIMRGSTVIEEDMFDYNDVE